jgi:hypothetical protein
MVRAVSWSWFRGTDCSVMTLLFENIGWRFSCLFLAVRFSGGEAAIVREVARWRNRPTIVELRSTTVSNGSNLKHGGGCLDRWEGAWAVGEVTRPVLGGSTFSSSHVWRRVDLDCPLRE